MPSQAKKIGRKSLASRFLKSPLNVVSSIIILGSLFGAIFAPLIAPQNPYDLASLSLRNAFMPPVWLEGGDPHFLLGTDNTGRDIFSTILYGLRISFMVGAGVVVLSGSIGILAGIWAGLKGGFFDALIMRLGDIVFSFSTTLMAILIMGVIGAKGILIIILAIFVTDWVRYARTSRGNTLSLKHEEFISAAHATGTETRRLILKHILPNILPPLLVIAAVDFAVVIVLEATLSFLGIGVPITEPSLGMMISNGNQFIYAGHWWMIVFPGLMLILLTMSINLLGDWLRDELNPRNSNRSGS